MKEETELNCHFGWEDQSFYTKNETKSCLFGENWSIETRKMNYQPTFTVFRFSFLSRSSAFVDSDQFQLTMTVNLFNPRRRSCKKLQSPWCYSLELWTSHNLSFI